VLSDGDVIAHPNGVRNLTPFFKESLNLD